MQNGGLKVDIGDEEVGVEPVTEHGPSGAWKCISGGDFDRCRGLRIGVIAGSELTMLGQVSFFRIYS